jgi:hypothetical protein
VADQGERPNLRMGKAQPLDEVLPFDVRDGADAPRGVTIYAPNFTGTVTSLSRAPSRAETS